MFCMLKWDAEFKIRTLIDTLLSQVLGTVKVFVLHTTHKDAMMSTHSVSIRVKDNPDYQK